MRLSLLAALFLLGGSWTETTGAPPPEQSRWELQVNEVQREALVFASRAVSNAPVVFIFHGHGGTAEQAARSFGIHQLWPEAVCIYPQGLKTPGQITDPEGKRSGWQKWPGDQADRDLKFFDALLAEVAAKYDIDRKRVFATGHSNGGAFTYLLWATRPAVFRAMAPSAAAANVRYAQQLTPKPALHLAGRNDVLVKFEWQKRMMESVRNINGCAATGQSWAPNCTLYRSTKGAPFITYIDNGGHKFASAGPALIVRFFQEQ